MNILNVEIPDSLATRTIAKTNWQIRPIREWSDIPPPWVGGKYSQVAPVLLRQIWDFDAAGLQDHRAYIVEELQRIIDELTGNGLLLDGEACTERSRSVANLQNMLIGGLRRLYLVDCRLLAIANNERESA